MTNTTLVPAETPGGETVVVPVVDLDGTATVPDTDGQNAGDGLPGLTDALKSINDFAAGLRQALHTAVSGKTTVGFSIGFAMRGGKITAMFVDGKDDGPVTVTMELGTD